MEEKYRLLEANLLLQNPWDIPKVKKIGLDLMYIIDALAEVLQVKADLSHLEPNPRYEALKNGIEAFYKERNDDTFDALVSMCGVTWDDLEDWSELSYVPDIRVLETPLECLNWLYCKYMPKTNDEQAPS